MQKEVNRENNKTERKPSRAVAINKWQPIDLKAPAFAKKITPRSLELVDNLEKANWINLGKQLSQLTGSVQWWWGDWWAFAERTDRKYGDLRAIMSSDEWDSDMPSYQTLLNWAVVSRAVAPERRKYDLPYSHYKEVCHKTPEEQDELLKWALKEGKSVSDIRSKIYEQGKNKEIDKAAKSDPPETEKAEDKKKIIAPKVEEFEEDEPINEKQMTDYKRKVLQPLTERINEIGKYKMPEHRSTRKAMIEATMGLLELLEKFIEDMQPTVATPQPKK